MEGKKFCPECGGEDIQASAGGIGGGWMCNDCCYNGVCPEKMEDNEEDLVMDDLKMVKQKAIKSKGRKKK